MLMQYRYVFNILAMKNTVRVFTKKKKTLSLSSSIVEALGSIYQNAKKKCLLKKKCKLDNVIII